MKKIVTVIFCAFLVISLSLSVFASSPAVVDDADLLTSAEESRIESRISEIRSRYDFDIVVVLPSTLGGKSPVDFADDYYDYNGYGCGENGDGCLLLISIEDGDLWISTKGRGLDVFTDYGINYVCDKMVDEAGLSDGRYYDSVICFLDQTAEYLECAENGKPFDEDSIPTDWRSVILTSAVISVIIAVIVSLMYVGRLKSQLKSVAPKKDANNYVDNSSLRLSVSKDTFLCANVSKTPRPQNNSSGRSGGSSGHFSSSGSFHGGGGRKF